MQAQRALDRNLPVAEGGVGEDFGLRGLLEIEEAAADALDVLVGDAPDEGDDLVMGCLVH